jgi:hypothetical protein
MFREYSANDKILALGVGVADHFRVMSKTASPTGEGEAAG